jgi:phosphatidylglycerophosphate synthase
MQLCSMPKTYRMDSHTLSRIIRWFMACVFGIVAWKFQSWEVGLFALIFLVSGFFKPRRCSEEGCDL